MSKTKWIGSPLMFITLAIIGLMVLVPRQTEAACGLEGYVLQETCNVPKTGSDSGCACAAGTGCPSTRTVVHNSYDCGVACLLEDDSCTYCYKAYGVCGFEMDCAEDIDWPSFAVCAGAVTGCVTACSACIATPAKAACIGCVACVVAAGGGCIGCGTITTCSSDWTTYQRTYDYCKCTMSPCP